jgi:hypothetical protein
MKKTQRKYWSFIISLIVVSLAFVATIFFATAQVGFTTFAGSIAALLTIYNSANVAQKKLTGKDDSIIEDK